MRYIQSLFFVRQHHEESYLAILVKLSVILYATLNCVQKIEKKFTPKMIMNVILRSFHVSADLT